MFLGPGILIGDRFSRGRRRGRGSSGDTILNSEKLGYDVPGTWEWCPRNYSLATGNTVRRKKKGIAKGVAGRYITRMFTVFHPPIGPREEERYA